MKELKGQTDIDIKRFYFDAILKAKCPNCGTEMERDFNDDYLNYPEVDKIEEMGLYCHECDKEYVFPYKVKSAEVTIEYDETKIKL